jgi:hypothetical protein
MTDGIPVPEAEERVGLRTGALDLISTAFGPAGSVGTLAPSAPECAAAPQSSGTLSYGAVSCRSASHDLLPTTRIPGLGMPDFGPRVAVALFARQRPGTCRFPYEVLTFKTQNAKLHHLWCRNDLVWLPFSRL